MNLFRSKKDDKKTERERVDERREEVLAQGRKFKYPLQYTKHRIVINTILIGLVILALSTLFGWLALYKFQMTDELLYRVTAIFPASVAEVEDEKVRFSDYLMLYRSSVLLVERQSTAMSDDESLKEQYKRAALTNAEEYTYALKLAKENGVEVTEAEVDAEFERHRQVGGVDRSEEGFLKILKDNFGFSKSEYKRLLKLNLVKAKVSEVIDKNASQVATQVEQILNSNGGNYKAAAESLGSLVVYEETGGLVDSKNIDGGRATEATKLEAGGQSGKFVSINGDGFYFVKLIEKADSRVNFVSIYVPFVEFERRFSELQRGEQIKEYIELKEM